jgi:hypothetical protein
MTPKQWWVALGLAGLMVAMQLYDRVKPAYDGWSAPGQSQQRKR